MARNIRQNRLRSRHAARRPCLRAPALSVHLCSPLSSLDGGAIFGVSVRSGLGMVTPMGRASAAATAGGALVLVLVLGCMRGPVRREPVTLYPEHMVPLAQQYGYGYGKPGVGYGPAVWAEESRAGERKRFPWPMSSNRWWVDRNDGPGLSNDGRSYPIPYIPHLRDDLAGGDMWEGDWVNPTDTPVHVAQDHAGGGHTELAWDAYAYTPWARSITPTKAPRGEWHQRRWNKVLRALWDKKYYLKPYYASEPIHNPVLHLLHLKDFVQHKQHSEPPESQRLMLSGADEDDDSAGHGYGTSERKRLSHAGRTPCKGADRADCAPYSQQTNGWGHPFAGFQGKQVRGRVHHEALAATARRHLQRKVWQEHASATGTPSAAVRESMMREANGGHEAQRLLDGGLSRGGQTSHQPTGSPRATADSRRFYMRWSHGERRDELSADAEPPSSPRGVARWWRGLERAPVADAGDVWDTARRRRERAQEHVAAKAHLLDLCFGTLRHHPANNLLGEVTSSLHKRGNRHRNEVEKGILREAVVSDPVGTSAWEKPGHSASKAREATLHEQEKEAACRVLRAAGTAGLWLP